MESNRYTVSGPVRQSALMRPSMIKPEVNSTKMNHEVIDTQNTEQDHRKFLETGDDALYSAENMRKRAALKEDPQIRAWITMFFRTFSMQTKPWCAGHKNEALCSVEEDLQRDLGDREQMSFHEFSESLFEIVDMWTLTCEKDEYLIFLRNLYLRISEPSITGSRQFRRVDAVVSVETPDLTAILKEGEVLKADRELDDTEIQQMNDDFESSRQSDIELGIAPRGSGLEAQASEEAARPSRRTVAAAGGARRRAARPVGGRDPTLARNNARGKYQGASEPIWRAPGRRNDSHEGEYDGYDGDGRAPKKKKDGTNMWLVGGVMRTRNTGVLRYLGPSDGHTLPQDALSRGGSAERANNRDGVAEAVGKGGRRKKEKAIPRTAAWLFHMDQASWGGDASSLDADSFTNSAAAAAAAAARAAGRGAGARGAGAAGDGARGRRAGARGAAGQGRGPPRRATGARRAASSWAWTRRRR
ncbi:hypothetical protein JL720_9936 [Aureococcus anophagefferens]|nr:hypothetical protein JL720_9936 [Aureococcus anophagefferens]